MSLGIRRAEPADAPALAVLAERIFREAYAAVTAPDDLERHLSRSFSDPRLVEASVGEAAVEERTG